MKKLIQKTLERYGYQLVKKPAGDPNRLADRPVVLLGSYHKTGTVWLMTVFMDAAKRTGRGWEDVSRIYNEDHPKYVKHIGSAKPGSILFDDHTHFPDIPNTEGLIGIRMVRDPRDVVLSAGRYHRRSKEPWLHVPQEQFGGKTYQEAINAIDDPLKAFEFELNNAAGRAINDMVNLPNADIFKTVKYEDMISDKHMTRWLEMFIDLGFRGDELAACLSAVWANSLFGKKGKEDSKHISDGSVSQWKSKCTPQMLAAFNEKFPTAVDAMGYEH